MADNGMPTGSPGRLLRLLLRGVLYRLDLFELELVEEERRYIARLVEVLLAGFFLFLGFLVLNFALILLFWNNNPALLALSLGVLYTVIGLLLGWRVLRKLEQSKGPFVETLRVLRKDLSLLRSLR